MKKQAADMTNKLLILQRRSRNGQASRQSRPHGPPHSTRDAIEMVRRMGLQFRKLANDLGLFGSHREALESDPNCRQMSEMVLLLYLLSRAPAIEDDIPQLYHSDRD